MKKSLDGTNCFYFLLILPYRLVRKRDPYGLSSRDPVTITIWQYYNGVQKEEFDSLVRMFNENEGRTKGIIVKAYNKGSIDELEHCGQ